MCLMILKYHCTIIYYITEWIDVTNADKVPHSICQVIPLKCEDADVKREKMKDLFTWEMYLLRFTAYGEEASQQSESDDLQDI